MSLVLTTLLWFLVALLVLLVGLLVTPLRLRLRVISEPKPHFLMAVRLFGGITPPMRVIDSSRKKDKPEEIEKPEEITEPAKPKKTKKKSRLSVNGPEMLTAIPNLLNRLIQCVHIENLSVDAEFGLKDPAETGHLFGMLTPFIYGTTGFQNTSILLRPTFDGARLNGELETNLRITPAALFPPFVSFAWQAFRPRR